MSPIWSKNCTSLAIDERHLPIESTIASRSTDVMMAANQTTNNNLIRLILDKEKLNGSNFLDWYRNLRIVLRNEQKLYHLVSMTLEIQKNLEDRTAFKILQELKTMFQQQAEQELFETVKAFHACKQKEGQSVSTYVLKMKANLDQMDHLGYPMPLFLGVNLILTSLSKDYDQFMQNYNMHGMKKTIPELHAMLKLAEKGTPKKAPAVLAIRQGQIQKPKLQARGKGKNKGKGKKLKKNKASTSGTSGVFTIELYSFLKSNSCIYDAGCGTHICNTIQGLRGIRKLNKGALDLYVGNGNRSAVKAIGIFDLILPSGMVLVLDNYHFAPSITRGVILLSRLWDKGFLYKFTNNGAISVSKDNVFYFNVIPRDGIFEIDMHNHVSNERSIYTCSNKKSKHNLDSTFLWHCRLGHINKKRIAKLQHDRLCKSSNDESFDVCVCCISGKMARKPFTHASERADDLLGLIHSDVCGPFRTTSREGANYYVTFTDDFSRHGYPKEIMGYYFYYPLENIIFVAWHAEFFKNSLILQEASGSTIDFDEIQRQDAQPSKNTSKHQPEAEHDDDETQTNEHELGDHGEPPNYRVALSDPESKKYLESMNTEMQSMKDNQVWNLVFLLTIRPVGVNGSLRRRPIWMAIYMDGNIHTYKACLVAKGFTQTYGVDYEETFSPVADIKAIRILIAIAAYYDYKIWQMDVKTAFLNGHLNEDVYMVQPGGFVNPKHHRRVCKLQRSIYGLKQASRRWNKIFYKEIKKYGFTQNPDEPCIYKRASGSIFVFLILYIDDLLLMGNNIPMLQDAKSWLGKCFAMKDLDLSKTQGPFTPAEVMRMKGVPYASAIGSIMYVNRVLVTKPHNKTPYELLHGRPPSISFMRPFGCPVTILNTLDPLGKFDEKSSKDAVADDAGKKTNEDPVKEDDKSDKDVNGNSIYRMFTLVNAVRSSCDNLNGSIPVNAATLPNDNLPTDPFMPDLEDTTATVKTVDNGEQEITATVDGKEFTITEASVRRHLQLANVDSYEKKDFLGNQTPLFPTNLQFKQKMRKFRHPSEPQPPPSTAQPIHEEPILNVTSKPIPNVPDKTVYKEWDDRVERATTTAASLDAEQASGASMPVNVLLYVQEGNKDKVRRRRGLPECMKKLGSFNIEEWEDIQATIEADEELAQRIQAEEREKYSEAEKARLLAELIN
ncbi:retrotransposon protein, putative, ty1-copia subclass [Tanacetum coccineum]